MKTIFFGASGSIVKWAYKDVYENPEIEYCEFNKKTISDTKIRKLLFLSGKGKLLPYFIKDKLYKNSLNYKFLKSNENEFLFVFTCQFGMLFEGGFFTFVSYLKKKYKNCKLAFYYNDIIDTCEPSKFESIKSIFDLVLTFDKKEADKYDIKYYGVVHSKCEPASEETAEESDVFYVGSDRGRFDTIMETFMRLSNQGKRCVFYLFEILKENENKLAEFTKKCKRHGKAFMYKNSLLYVNEYCWYGKTLKYITKTKCLFEVLLPVQTAGTLRLAESVMYGKKLITNCTEASKKPYYRAENIFIFNKPEDIDCGFLDIPYVPVDYDFSPLKMIEFIEKQVF